MKDSKKDMIIRAAEEEFMRNGFEGARMVEIAKRAGVGHPLLYYHFSTKEALFHHVVKEKMGMLAEAVQLSLEQSNKTLKEKLTFAISSHFDFVRENLDCIRFTIREIEKHPELFEDAKMEAHTNLKQISNKFQQELDAAAQKGDIVPLDAEMLMDDMIALNVFSQIPMPVLRKIRQIEDVDAYYEKRKKENVALILARLHYQNK